MWTKRAEQRLQRLVYLYIDCTVMPERTAKSYNRRGDGVQINVSTQQQESWLNYKKAHGHCHVIRSPTNCLECPKKAIVLQNV